MTPLTHTLCYFFLLLFIVSQKHLLAKALGLVGVLLEDINTPSSNSTTTNTTTTATKGDGRGENGNSTATKARGLWGLKLALPRSGGSGSGGGGGGRNRSQSLSKTAGVNLTDGRDPEVLSALQNAVNIWVVAKEHSEVRHALTYAPVTIIQFHTIL